MPHSKPLYVRTEGGEGVKKSADFADSLTEVRTRGAGGRGSENFADVLNGSPLTSKCEATNRATDRACNQCDMMVHVKTLSVQLSQILGFNSKRGGISVLLVMRGL